jgi:hypothetical protein
MGQYAADTTVNSEASRAEIERTLRRYGADSFAYGWDREQAMVGFRMNDRQVKFMLPMPDRQAREFTHTEARRYRRSEAAAEAQYEKAIRQRWRALALVIKAKLEAVESGITEFESEFLAHIVLPDGRTAGEWLSPQIEHAYETGQMPAMLPALEAGSAV